MSKTIYGFGFLVVAIIIILVFLLQPPELQLVNLNPKTLELEENDRKPITFQIQSNKNKTFNNIRIVPEVKNDNSNFLKIEEFIYDKQIVGEKATSKEDLSIYATPINSEGNELQYLVDLILFANDDDKKHSQEITVKITPNPLRTPIRISPQLSKEIQFIDLNPKSITLKEFGNPQTFNFRIQSNVPEEIKDIKVQSYVYNNSGKYLEMNGFDFTESLSGVGETTGVKSIKMSAKESEGIKPVSYTHLTLPTTPYV